MPTLEKPGLKSLDNVLNKSKACEFVFVVGPFDRDEGLSELGLNGNKLIQIKKISSSRIS